VAEAYARGSGGTLRDTTPSMDDGGGLQWVVLHDTEA
jgi:hypothetical protein